MKIINKKAIRFNEQNDWFDDNTVREMRGYQSDKDDNFEIYDADANEIDIPEVTTDEEVEGMLADDFVGMAEDALISPADDYLQEGDNLRRMQEGLPEEEPLVKKRDEVDEVDESVVEETEVDERVPDFATTKAAIDWAMNEHRVVEIFYVTRGRGSQDEARYLKRERGLSKEEGGGVNIHRIVEPHYVYAAGNGREIVITYDRSVRRIRSFIIDNIYDYNFTKNRRTKKDQYFKPRNRVMPSTLSGSEKGIKTMKNIKETLVKIASTLNNKGLKKSSEIVKNAEKALSNFKMAQYVGVQGYWLRNRRCWDNCYRQKRTSKPGSSAQEVWMECWDEYREAINNPKSTWAKYANKSDTIKVSKKEEQVWNKIFANKVEEKMKEGLSRPESIYTVIEAESQAYSIKVIEASSNLMTLADTLVSGGHEEVGRQMAEMSMEMLKEAEIGGQQQNFIGRGIDKVKNFFGGFRGKGGKVDVQKKIQEVISRAYGLLKMLSGSNVRQAQTTGFIIEAQTTGFIIEAGKGTTFIKEAYSKEQLDKDQAAERKSKGIRTEDEMSSQFGAKEENPDSDDDGDGVNNEQDVDDSPPDNIPDDQQVDTDGDGFTDDKDVDADGNNVADTQEKTPSLRESYTSLMDDVSGLITELSGLQSAKDPQVAQWAKGAVPFLHSFISDSSVINQTSKGDRTQAIKQIVIQLAKGLQGVLAGQASTAQSGGQLGSQQLGNQQLGNQQPGNQQPGNQQQHLNSIATMVAKMSKEKEGPALARALQSNAVPNLYLNHMMEQFELNGVPFTTSNWEQFKNQLVAAFTQQNTGNKKVI